MIIVNTFVLLNIAFLSFILLSKKNNPLPNKILAAILIAPSLNFLNNINILTGTIYYFPILFFIVQGTAALFAPLVYSYIRLLSGKKINLRSVLFIVTLFIILADILLALNFFSQDKFNRNFYLQSIAEGTYPKDMELYNIILFIHQLIYFSISGIAISRLKRSALQSVSSFKGTGIRYMSRFINLCWLLTLVTVVLYLSPIQTIYVEYVFLPLVLIIIFYFILYYGFQHNFVFSKNSYEEFLENNSKNKKAYNSEKNALVETEEDTELQKTINLLETYFENNEIFTRPDITLYSLAIETKIPVKKLSLAINKIKGKNFYDFINDKRIEKAVTLLETHRNYSIEAIASDSGFNSRSAFYRAFKKNTGFTPTQYISSLKTYQV